MKTAENCKYYSKNINKFGILKTLDECRNSYISDSKCIGIKCKYYTT